MRILYIGETDCLAKVLVSRLEQEGEEVFVVADKEFPSNDKMQNKYKFYQAQDDAELCRILFASITPDTVIFAGNGYLQDVWKPQGVAAHYIPTLQIWCELCAESESVDVIYLSSVEALGEHPETVKGTRYALGEKLLSFYQGRGLQSVQTLYCDALFSMEHTIGDGSFLSNMVGELRRGGTITLPQDKVVYPVSIGDAVDGVLRVMLRGTSSQYVICGSNGLQKSEIYRYLAEKEGLEPQIVVENASCDPVAYANEKAKKELEWVEFHPLTDLLTAGKITVTDQPKQGVVERKYTTHNGTLRKTIENIVLFLLCFALNFFTSSNSALSGIDVMMLYIVVVSALYGVSGGFLGVVLRSLGFWLGHFVVQTGGADFQMYLDTMLMIAQSVFVTLIVAYPIDYLRATVERKNSQIDDMEMQKEEIAHINHSNVVIKNEYQQRLLDAKNSFSALHKTITRINSLEVDRIFMEIVQVISELIGTSTVSAYRFQKKGGYMRLVTNLNDASIFTGYSLNLDDYPEMKACVENGEVYRGDIWNHEPALVAPILHQKELMAIIVINDLPFEKQTLYQINLLRTVTALASDAANKAIAYEHIIEEDWYVDNTTILKPEIMEQRIALAKEKSGKQLSHYVLLEVAMDAQGDYAAMYHRLRPLIRKDDMVGLGQQNELLLLLPSTPMCNVDLVIQRFHQHGVEARVLSSDMEDSPVRALEPAL